MIAKLDEAANTWIDSRGVFPKKLERGCFETLMLYEVRDYLSDAFEAGAAWERERILAMLNDNPGNIEIEEWRHWLERELKK